MSSCSTIHCSTRLSGQGAINLQLTSSEWSTRAHQGIPSLQHQKLDTSYALQRPLPQLSDYHPWAQILCCELQKVLIYRLAAFMHAAIKLLHEPIDIMQADLPS